VENLGVRVAVVGAGYAGMAAAVALAGRRVPVTVFEAGPVPGGRARRVQSRGETFDNGQHILSGAYRELLRLMQVVGVPSGALLRVPLELRYADGFAFRAARLPGPLGTLAGLLSSRRLPWSERFGAVRFMLALRRSGFHLENDLAVSELLGKFGQSGAIGHYLWRPLCVSALNTPPELASANAFLAVLRDALAGEGGSSDLLLPRVDLSRLFPEPACEFVARHGGEIRTGTAVRSVSPDLKINGEPFDRAIVAVGPYQLDGLLPGMAPAFSYQPITTCYLQYAASVRLPFPMLGFAGGLVQWVFDRGALTGEGGRLACVISAQGDHQQMQQDELAAACDRELRTALPGLGPVRTFRVISEKRATIACSPRRPRIAQTTSIPGLFLAGDYTDPEYPPVLEAAVRSGLRAADLALPG
jgi:squalene-associated FAD-dependent desaturase